MPGLVDRLARPPVLDRVSQASRDPAMRDPAMLHRLIADLDAMRLEDVALKWHMYDDPAQARHFVEHWLDRNGHGYWRSQQPIEPRLVAALKRAARLVERHQMPIQWQWVPNDTRFWISLSVGGAEITGTIYTPPLGDPLADGAPDETLWIVEEVDGAIVDRPAKVVPAAEAD